MSVDVAVPELAVTNIILCKTSFFIFFGEHQLYFRKLKTLFRFVKSISIRYFPTKQFDSFYPNYFHLFEILDPFQVPKPQYRVSDSSDLVLTYYKVFQYVFSEFIQSFQNLYTLCNLLALNPQSSYNISMY